LAGVRLRAKETEISATPWALEERTLLLHTASSADRALAAAGPGLWNGLLSHLKEADLSYNRFQRFLETFLFG